MLSAVVNLSEGRDGAVLTDLARAAGDALLDVHSDGDHHRSVFTLGGPDVEEATQRLTRRAVEILDLRAHRGVHPRIGVVDVVPWVCLEGWPVRDGSIDAAVAARDRFARWAGDSLGVPCFSYGPLPPSPGRTLPEVRRGAWHDLAPDTGPAAAHQTAGAIATGARPVLVAYNLWLADADIDQAREIARALRGPALRTLGLAVGDAVQVSCNLIAPWVLGPGAVFDAVDRQAPIHHAELVGLVPEAVLAAEPPHRWAQLDVDPSRTIEARLEEAGLDGGRP